MSPRYEAPIIITGASGSGSTLLDRSLNAHPDIHIMGETKFLVANAWAAFNGADANTTLRQNRLLFSTSDNSSPNDSARVYSFDLGEAASARIMRRSA
jgi:hypothetical protein